MADKTWDQFLLEFDSEPEEEYFSKEPTKNKEVERKRVKEPEVFIFESDFSDSAPPPLTNKKRRDSKYTI